MKNVLVVGLGNMGLSHITLLPKAEVTIFGSDPAIGSRIVAQELYGVTETADHYRNILNRHNIDLAIVCSPPGTHYEVVTDLIVQGVPTYIEKPGFETVEEFDQIQALALKHDCPFRIGTQLPYDKDVFPMIERIAAERYGKLRYVEFEDHAPYFGSAKQGCANQSTIVAFIADMLSHSLSLVVPVSEALTDLSVRAIKEQNGTPVGAVFILQLDQHIECTIRLDFGSAQVRHRISYHFNDQNLLYDFKLSRWMVENYATGNPIFSRMLPNISVGSQRLLYGLINPIKLLLNLSNSYAGASAFACSLIDTTLSEQLESGELEKHRKVIDYQSRCMAALKPLIDDPSGTDELQPVTSDLLKGLVVAPEIIVSGANGFIGLSLVRESIKQGRHILAVARSTNAELEQLAASEWVTLLKIENYQDLLALDIELKANTPFINLAGPTSGGYSRQANATIDIMNAVIDFSLKHHLQLYHVGSVTTCATSNYFLPNRLSDMKKESQPYNKSAYTFAKHLAERYLAEAAIEKGLKYNIIHPGSAWSDSKRDAVLVKLGSIMRFDIYAGSGSRCLPDIHVDELASRICSISSEAPQNRKEHLLIAHSPHTNRSFYDKYIKCAERRAIFIPRTLLFMAALIIDKVRGRHSATYPRIGFQLRSFSPSWPKE